MTRLDAKGAESLGLTFIKASQLITVLYLRDQRNIQIKRQGNKDPVSLKTTQKKMVGQIINLNRSYKCNYFSPEYW